MERKTPQKILLWNDCHVSYIWFKDFFYSCQVTMKIKTKNIQKPLKLVAIHLLAEFSGHSFSGRI